MDRFSPCPFDQYVAGTPEDQQAREQAYWLTDGADEWRALYAKWCDAALMDAYADTPVTASREAVVRAYLAALDRRTWADVLARTEVAVANARRMAAVG